jgi:hypothetical protein
MKVKWLKDAVGRKTGQTEDIYDETLAAKFAAAGFIEASRKDMKKLAGLKDEGKLIMASPEDANAGAAPMAGGTSLNSGNVPTGHGE